MASFYHYTESGLDNIYLAPGGFDYVDGPSGRAVKITDLEGLHVAIAKVLIEKKKDLTGREIRFLRQEMLLSQASLAKLLDVTEQTVHRWENNKTDIPKPAESLIRFLYVQKCKPGAKLDELLKKLADLEDELDGHRLELEHGNKWQLKAA